MSHPGRNVWISTVLEEVPVEPGVKKHEVIKALKNRELCHWLTATIKKQFLTPNAGA